ncbi:putative hydrolase of the HAD superfamily [Amycolatopsis viridis]|uniref:Hydrolase of the HAD superfamily n=1 Tax=Amycolatopsis viridis TaxID=185678 RepID=A0ABX0SR35_9PSEU|nr:putative hydrolase of the HAD superfamily [Amycolatopsis viridis]
MGIPAVVFDIGGVLEITGEMTFSREWESKLGLSPGEIGRRLADVWAGGTVARISEDDVHRAIGDELGLAGAQVELMMSQMWTEYLGVANDELIEYVRGLRPRYRTGILSNSFVGAREREQEAYGFPALVDDLVYSHEVGMTKPDPRIYQLTCARLGAAPEETIFVDDLDANVTGALDAGLHAVRYRDNADDRRDRGCCLVHRGGQRKPKPCQVRVNAVTAVWKPRSVQCVSVPRATMSAPRAAHRRAASISVAKTPADTPAA